MEFFETNPVTLRPKVFVAEIGLGRYPAEKGILPSHNILKQCLLNLSARLGYGFKPQLVEFVGLEVEEVATNCIDYTHNRLWIKRGITGSNATIIRGWLEGKEVAVKVIPPDVADDKETAPFKLLEELNILNILDHPSIPAARYPFPVYVKNTYEDPTMVGIVVEYFHGYDLTAIQSLRLNYAIKLFARLGDALAHAHSRKIIHGDLKLNNIMIGSGSDAEFLVKIVDWGPRSRTPPYAAPEQFTGKRYPSSDIHALGVMLYYLITNRRYPFPAVKKDKNWHIRSDQLYIPIMDTEIASDRLRDKANEVIQKATAFHPKDRYLDIQIFIAAVIEVLKRLQDERECLTIIPESSNRELSPQLLRGGNFRPSQSLV